MQKCRFAGCFTTKIQRFGLCNKHRKWVERGYMTEDLVMLKEPKRVGSYRDSVCKIPGCKERPRRNMLCMKHSSQMRSGTLLPNGDRVYKKVLRYSVDATCKVHRCDKESRIIKGFCKSHYSLYRRGLMDFDGFETGRRKRVAGYDRETDRCKVRGCEGVPRDVGFCRMHSSMYRTGSIDIDGRRLKRALIKNAGKVCSLKDCGRPAYCQSYCRKHYARYLNCVPFEREFVNKGKTCCYMACQSPAVRKGYCSRHHYRLMNDRPMSREFKNKGNKCTQCDYNAYARGLCRSCYGRFRYEAKKSSVQLVTRDG
jgi:hypothetical protein